VKLSSSAPSTIAYRPPQKRFLDIPQTPLCYWLRPRFFELLAGRTLGDVASVVQGLATANDPRFVRFVWETPPSEWVKQVRSRRWVPFEKGGGYGKWFGHHWWTVDWEKHGARIKQTPGPRVQNEQYYFREGWTYTTTARGSLGLRFLNGSAIFAHKSSAIFFSDALRVHSSLLNCRISSHIIRGIRAQIDLSESYVAHVPILDSMPSPQKLCQSASVSLKRTLVSRDLTERTFDLATVEHDHSRLEPHAIAAVLHSVEGFSEKLVFDAYGLAADDTAAVLDETGTPVGWYPLIRGFDEIPPIPNGLPQIPQQTVEFLQRHERLELPSKALADLKAKLSSLYEAGPGATSEEGAPESEDENADEEEEQAAVGARIPIPAETFLEELSQKLEIHPISVYWLLKEGVEKEGWRCPPEEQRLAAERITVMILRLLGHRWPSQIEAGEAVPDWADGDGIIPFTGGTGEPSLIERLRGASNEPSFEKQFSEAFGKPLEQWIESEFFKYQTSLFRKRPIAWQIQSARFTRKRRPAFSCLVYYHKLDGDLLPKIRTQYIGPLQQKFETELRSIGSIPERSRSDRQDERRAELVELIAELKDFDERLKGVIEKGFATQSLQEMVEKGKPDKWCSPDGVAAPSVDREAFIVQESRYLPDVNDGVRVNIAPLQKSGLFASDVLSKKDVEEAIADRAQWRADERRWCREGKLPQPGWWKS